MKGNKTCQDPVQVHVVLSKRQITGSMSGFVIAISTFFAKKTIPDTFKFTFTLCCIVYENNNYHHDSFTTQPTHHHKHCNA